MKIYSMTATFGKLDGVTLELSEGLNIITAPNEWGKSTWCAFLTAMLYGIDTRERSTKDQLADKEHYQPWSGKSMSGRIRLEWNGRDITIERRTKGRIPLGELIAYETHSGLPVEQLRADNCGQVLLGVERSVFMRTGFIRFTDLPVQQDEALRRRLNALVTTGDESGSADLLAKKLREYKNRCRYNRSGLIPDVQAQIQTLQQQLHEQTALSQQAEQLQAQIQKTEAYRNQLEVHRNTLAYQQSAEAVQQVNDAADTVKAAQAELDELESRCKRLPPRGELLGKLTQAQALLKQIDATPMKYPKSLLPCIILWALSVLIAIGAGLLWFSGTVPAAVGAFALSLVFVIVSTVVTDRRRRYELNRRIEEKQLDDRQNELSQQMAQWRHQLELVEHLERMRRETIQAKIQLQSLLAMAKKADKPDQADSLTLGKEETMNELNRANELLQRCRIQLGQCQGKMELLPDYTILQSQLSFAQRRLKELEKTYRALDFGQKALETATQELQRRFAPRITRRAGQFLSRLTQGQYDRISIGEDLTIQAAKDSETTLRTAQWRSDGTSDQMYLALRLAVWEALNPHAPLILDDALIRFDQQRLECALQLLKELSRSRQILLLSCQDREKNLINP